MTAYLAKRVMLMLPVLFGVTLIVFFAIRLVPGDALLAQMESAYLGKETMDRIRHDMGLDVPVYEQYVRWVSGAVRGDFGNSLFTGKPVWDRLSTAIPVTAELAVLAILIAALIGIPVGVLAAVTRGSWIDQVSRALSVAGMSVPMFVLATLVIALPAIWWHYFPSLYYQPLLKNPLLNLQQMLPAAISLGAMISAVSMRMTRSTVLEVLREDYIRTARAKGLSSSVVLVRHALSNSMLPVLSILGEQFGFLLAGAVITETIFGFPGVGQLTLEAVMRRDYTQLQGNIMLIATVFLCMNLLVDLAYGWLDPRIRFS